MILRLRCLVPQPRRWAQHHFLMSGQRLAQALKGVFSYSLKLGIHPEINLGRQGFIPWRNSIFAFSAYAVSLIAVSWYARLPLEALPVWTTVTPLVIAVAVAGTYRWVRQSAPGPLPGLMIASVALLWALFFFTPPFAAQRLDDLNHYYFHGKMLARYGLNPYVVAPSAVAADPDYPAVAIWHWFRFNYGPLWLALAALVALVTDRLAVGVLLLRTSLAAAAVAGIGLAARLSTIASAKVGLGHSQGRQLLGMSWALHPLLLVWGLSGGHNDVIVAVVLLAALALGQRGRWQVAALAVVAAALFKPVAVVWWPMFWLAGVAAAADRRLRVGVQMVLAAFGLALVAYVPVWPGWATIAGSIPTQNPLLAGPLVAVLRPWAGGSATAAAAVGFGFVYIAVLWWLSRSPSNLERIAAASLMVGLAMLAASPLLQPWYALWLVPFLIVLHRPWARWLEGGLIVASLTFYPLFYPVGWAVAVATVAGATIALWGLSRMLRGRKLFELRLEKFS